MGKFTTENGGGESKQEKQRARDQEVITAIWREGDLRIQTQSSSVLLPT